MSSVSLYQNLASTQVAEKPRKCQSKHRAFLNGTRNSTPSRAFYAMNLLFPLVICEKQNPRSACRRQARDDNQVPFSRKPYKRVWMRSASVLKSLTP